MNALASVAGVLAIAALTPGPNNFIVMHAATHGGPKAAARAIASVVAGSVALYAVFGTGFGALGARMPAVSAAAAAVGAVYLAWLGVSLATSRRGALHAAGLPASPAAVAAFQFSNPKAWALMGAVASSASSGGDWRAVVPVMVAIFVASLALWAGAGIVLARALQRPRTARAFNLAMGASLVAFALAAARVPAGDVWHWLAGS